MLRQGGEIVFKNAKEIVEREDVKQLVRSLRRRWKIPSKGIKDTLRYRTALNNLASAKILTGKYSPSGYSVFRDEVREACKKLKLPRHWEIFFARYIPTNSLVEHLKMKRGVTLNKIEKNNQYLIRIEFDANTLLKDIENIWKQVKELQKSFPDYDGSRTKRYSERDLNLVKRYKKLRTPNAVYVKLPNTRNIYKDISLDAVTKAIQRKSKLLKGQQQTNS